MSCDGVAGNRDRQVSSLEAPEDSVRTGAHLRRVKGILLRTAILYSADRATRPDSDAQGRSADI